MDYITYSEYYWNRSLHIYYNFNPKLKRKQLFRQVKRIRIIYDSSNWIEGVIPSFSSNSLFMTSDSISGSGSYSSFLLVYFGCWNTTNGFTGFTGFIGPNYLGNIQFQLEVKQEIEIHIQNFVSVGGGTGPTGSIGTSKFGRTHTVWFVMD